jgi:hypothetical protein
VGKPGFHELDQPGGGGNVQIGLIAIARLQVGLRLAGPDCRSFPVIMDGELVVVAGGVRGLEHPGQPEKCIIGDIGELTGELLPEKAHLVRCERRVPEEEAIELEIGESLREGGLKYVKNLVEIGRGSEALPYFFERVCAHGLYGRSVFEPNKPMSENQPSQSQLRAGRRFAGMRIIAYYIYSCSFTPLIPVYRLSNDRGEPWHNQFPM